MFISQVLFIPCVRSWLLTIMRLDMKAVNALLSFFHQQHALLCDHAVVNIVVNLCAVTCYVFQR